MKMNKILISENDSIEDIRSEVYSYLLYPSAYNLGIRNQLKPPTKYPAILVFSWDERYDVHSLDWEYIYLTDFVTGDNNES